MANFNYGIIKYDEQVEVFDMSGLGAEKIELPFGVMKNLAYFSDSVIYAMPQDWATWSPDSIQGQDMDKIARAGMVKAVGDLAKKVEEDAATDRALIRSEFAAADATLQSAIDAEKTRAEGAEATLQGNINTVSANLSSEVTRATGAEATLQANIDAEKARAEGVEAQLASDLASEVTRATGAESTLQSAIDAEKFRVDAILSGSQADKDSFAEIVALINQVDLENDSAFAAYALENDSKVTELFSSASAEEAARIAGDAAVQASLDAYKTSNDAALDAEKVRAEGVEAALQSELDATQGGAGLGFDGAYLPHPGNYIAQATSLMDADIRLDTQVKLNEDAIKDEETRALAAEAQLASDLATEVTRATGAEATLQGNIDAEKTRAESAEATLQGNIDAEKARAEGAEATLQANIDAEKARAEGVEGDLQKELDDTQVGAGLGLAGEYIAHVPGNFISQATSLMDADIRLDTALKAEEGFRIAGDVQTLTDAKAYTDTEVAAVQAALDAEIAATNADFAAEAQARVDGDAALQTAINDEKARIDAMLSGSSVDFDTLKEIVDAYQLADTNIVDSITNLSNSLSSEITARTNDVDAEEARATAAEGALQSELDATQAGAGLGFGGEYFAHVGGTYISGAVSLADADVKLDAAIKAGDDALSAELTVVSDGLADEIAARVAGDTALEAGYQAADAAIIAAYEAADTTLQTNINNEVARATAAENALSGRISDLEATEISVFVGVAGAVGAPSVIGAEFSHAFMMPNGNMDEVELPFDSFFGSNGDQKDREITVKNMSGVNSMAVKANPAHSFNGEVDGTIVLPAGATAHLIRHAGVWYVM